MWHNFLHMMWEIAQKIGVHMHAKLIQLLSYGLGRPLVLLLIQVFSLIYMWIYIGVSQSSTEYRTSLGSTRRHWGTGHSGRLPLWVVYQLESQHHWLSPGADQYPGKQQYLTDIDSLQCYMGMVSKVAGTVCQIKPMVSPVQILDPSYPLSHCSGCSWIFNETSWTCSDDAYNVW